jgi:uncharacterized protein
VAEGSEGHDPSGDVQVRPAVEGWFVDGDPPRLLGSCCEECGTVVFPPRALGCPNPGCDAIELVGHELSTRGHVWSYATNHYPPPPPAISPEPFEPYTVAAVELEAEAMVVLGQVAGDADDLRVGSPVELVLDTLFERDGERHLVHKWRPIPEGA